MVEEACLTDGKWSDFLRIGLAHLGSESEPGIIVQMSQEVLAKAKKGSEVSVFLAGGARTSGGSKSHRDGRTLFETLKTTALDDKRMPLFENTEDQLLIDNSPVDVRMHEGKGAPGAQMNRFEPKEFLMTF